MGAALEATLSLSIREQLLPLLGDFRQEWIGPNRSVFVRPPYFGQLESPQPCFLVGGRGTGKTTSLQSLAVASRPAADPTQDAGDQLGRYLGTYLKMNKNQVTAFARIVGEDSDALFGHYANLLICGGLVEMLKALATREGWPEPSGDELALVGESLGIHGVSSVAELSLGVRRQMLALQEFVNSPGRVSKPTLSIREAPVRELARLISNQAASDDRPIFVCVDEYENLSGRQQEIVNTYVKSSEWPIFYKVGMRRLGLKSRRTLNEDDKLSPVDDYFEIDISKSDFEAFARQVADRRLRAVPWGGAGCPSVDEFLPALDRRAEAELLGAKDEVTSILDELLEAGHAALAQDVKALGLDAYLIRYIQEADRLDLQRVAEDAIGNPSSWRGKVNNYGYASIFWLAKGKKGLSIRKHYSGCDTMLALAAGNIRYFLDLLHQGVAREDSWEVSQRAISFRAQTEAARAVGRRRIDEIEGLGPHSVEVKRLVLALGRVFFEYARDPVGHTPEVNQFVISGSGDSRTRIDAILKAGVSYLAFESSPRTKETGRTEVKDDEYRLHPIFSAYFEYSHRKKRRTIFDAEDLLLAISDPPAGIARILKGRRRVPVEDVPEQLSIFAPFYGAQDGNG